MSMNNFLALSFSFFGILFLCKSMIYILWSSQCKFYELWWKFLQRGNELPNYLSNIFIPNFNMRRFHLFCIWTASVYIEISSVFVFCIFFIIFCCLQGVSKKSTDFCFAHFSASKHLENQFCTVFNSPVFAESKNSSIFIL